MSRRVVVRAPAKVNLSLAVLGQRKDGYHELDTVLLGLDLADVLTLAPRASESDALVVRGPAAAGVPQDASNLVLRAVQAVRRIAREHGLRTPGLELTLEKHVPAQAGLGGGSSDAAAAALGACQLFGLDPDQPDVLHSLIELGSDCAFFLQARGSGIARCTGRGERVEPWPSLALPWSIALVTPGFGCATGDVYRALQVPSNRERTPPLEPARLAGALAELHARLGNDLELAAEHAQPALRGFRARLEVLAPGTFRLAGSGSSFFAFCADRRAAEALLGRLRADDEARRYGLRGRWVLPAESRGLALIDSTLH